jgi:beta-fructofuranosidase
MHIPSGFFKDGLGDIDVITHGDMIHAFYLSIPSHDRVGHLTSRDGLTWAEQPAAIYTGAPGDFDDDQIWTMGVFVHQGRFFMLYTGIAMKDRGKVQRIGLAVSDDLMVWTKHDKNPVIEADPRWYEAGVDGTHRVDWRDPWVYGENGKLYGVISARANQGPVNRRGCAGHFVSTNGTDWELRPPLCVPGCCYDFETPALRKLKGRYYLTGISGKESGGMAPSTVRVADRVEGPYRRIGQADLLPGDNQVFKPCHWKGMPLYFHNLRGIADWEKGGNGVITAMPPPKVADVDADGGLVLRPFTAWSPAALGEEVRYDAARLQAEGEAVVGRWQASGGSLQSEAAVSGYQALLLKEQRESMIMTAEFVAGEAREFGLLLRSHADADDATLVILTPAMRRVQLATLKPFYKTPSAGVTYRWRGRRVVQEWIDPQAWGDRLAVRVVAYGPYVEVSVDDRVAISAVTMVRPAGQIGFFSEDGRVGVRHLTVQPLRPPPCQAMCT